MWQRARPGKAVAAPSRGTRPAVTGLRSLLPSGPGIFDSRTKSPRSASLGVLMEEGSRPSHGLGSTRDLPFCSSGGASTLWSSHSFHPSELLHAALRRPGRCTGALHLAFSSSPTSSIPACNTKQLQAFGAAWSPLFSTATFAISKLPSPQAPTYLLTYSGHQGLHFLQSHCNVGLSVGVRWSRGALRPL